MNNFVKTLIEQYFRQNEYKYNENIKLLIESYFDLDKRTYTKYPDTYILDENMENEDSELDKELKGEESNIGSFIRQNTPIIYAFVTNMMKPAVKIGFTTQGAQKRLQQWQKYFPDAELIGYWTAVEFIEDAEKKTKTKVFFQDFPVHKETVRKGFANLTREEFDKEFDSLAQEDFSFDLSTLTRHYSKEFFKKENLEKRLLTKEVVEEIVQTVKDKIKAGDRTDIQTYGIDTFEKQRSGGQPLPIQNFQKTGLQEEAIKNGLQAIKNNKTHLLLGAVMRFGKTFTAYEIASQAHFRKIIVTSAVADTRNSWRDDIYHTDFMDKDNFCFIEFDNQKHQGFYLVTNKHEYRMEYEYTETFIEDYQRENGATVIFFTTLQDLSGKLENTGEHSIKNRHKEIFNIEWDLLIADETHFASRSSVNGAALGYTNIPEEAIQDATDADIKELTDQDAAASQMRELIKPLKTKRQLHLSGTPYNIMTTDEFTKENSDIIGRYSYTDMLQARDEWIEQHPNEPEWHSPYFGVPNLIRFGLNLTKECRDELKKLKKDNVSDSFSKLFEVRPGTLTFKNRKAIRELMYSIFGNPYRKTDNKLVGFLNRPEIKNGEVMKHIVICMPRVTSCHALAKLLNEHIFVKNNTKRKVIIAVENDSTIVLRNKGTGGYISDEAQDSNKLNKELNRCESQGIQTVTLTVNKLMTAVSVPLWDAMLYFKDTENSQEYDQNVFRICTRNVHKEYNPDGTIKSMTNLKENVYLIDFKIERLFNIMIDSTRSQNNVKGEKGLGAFERTIKENVEKMPIYLDGMSNALNKMHELNVKDFMQYYTKYNSERSIEDSIRVQNFGGWISTDKLDSIIDLFDPDYINKTKKISASAGEGTDDIVLPSVNKSVSDGRVMKSPGFGSGKLSKEDEKAIKNKRNKVISLLKNMMYLAMCLDECWTLDDMIKACQKDDKIANDFGLSYDMLVEIRKHSNSIELNEIDTEIHNIAILMNDKNRSPLENIQVAINKMGQIAKSEVVTPTNLVDKMLDKLDGEDLKGKSILEVNSKYGEFLIQIYKRFGKEVANNVKVVASSEMTKHFILKIINILGLDEQNLVELDDHNGNGYYDIKDFIEAPEKEILKFNKGMKFDVILANPPYDNGLHEKFSIKYFDICDGEICWVSPLSFLLGKRQNKKITLELDKYATDIEQINGNEYFDAAIGGTMGIVYVDMSINNQGVTFDGKKYKECKEISMISNDELLMSIKNKIGCGSLTDNVHEHILKEPGTKAFTTCKTIKNPNENWWIYRTKAFSGHSIARSKEIGEFYAFTSKQTKYNESCGLYKILSAKRDRNDNKYIQYYIAFNTEDELKNFWKYIHTDFFNICLYFVKTTLHLDNGELKYVPWQDFTEEWDDEKLFKKYGITKEEIQHIYDILPNYYGIERINLDKYVN